MSETQRNPSDRRSRRSPWIVVAAGGAAAVLLLASMSALSRLRTGRVSITTVGAESSIRDRIDVTLLVGDVDTARQEARLRLYAEPRGTLADPLGRFAEKIVIDSSNESSAGILIAEKGTRTLITEFVATFDQGDDVSFPFDRQKSTIWLEASNDDATAVPMRVSFEAVDSNFRFRATDISEVATAQTAPEFELIVERSGLTKTLAMIIVILMWALATAVVAVTWLVLTRATWRQRSFEVLGWLAAMLFALIQLRGVAPGAPGFGTLFDFIGFFWAELITAVSLCLIVVVLVRSELASAPGGRRPQDPLG